MTTKQSEAKAQPTQPKAKKNGNGKRKKSKGNKIRLRTQSGHRLYLTPIEMFVPGEEEEIEVTDAQLAHLTLDGRVMIDSQIDDYYKALREMKGRKARGNTSGNAVVKAMPKGEPVNLPGGKRLPKVAKVKDRKPHAELVAKEKAEREEVARKARGTSPAAKPKDKGTK